MKFLLKTFGCKLNQYESQLIRENLISCGFQETDSIYDSQYVIVASCAVTQDSVKGMRKFISSVRAKNPDAKIIVTGCWVNVYPEQVKKIQPYLALNNTQKYYLPAYLGKKGFKFKSRISGFKSHHRAFVKIQDGCDNRCSYCCVWMARGKSYSRSREEILLEIKDLLSAGYKEIVITGLCIGDYGKDINFSLVGLLSEIEKLDYEFRIRISSIEPQDVNEEMIDFLSSSEKVVPHLHIPVQSGSDRILKIMNRKYDSGSFRNLIRRLKDGNERFQFSTDVIVGFPAEEKKDFLSTVEILRELQPVRVHIFPFSPRPRTPAFEVQPRVNPKIIWERKRKLQEEIHRIIKDNLNAQVGKEFRVLLEGKKNGSWVGYTENYIKCFLESDESLDGEFRDVRLVSVDDQNLACYVQFI